MVFSNQINAAMVGTIVIITLSLFNLQIIKYFIGVGMFGVFFLFLIILTDNLEISTFLSIIISISMSCSYDYLIHTDISLAVLVIAISIIGFILTTVLLFTLWNYYRLDIGMHTNNSFFQLHRQIIENYRKILQILR